MTTTRPAFTARALRSALRKQGLAPVRVAATGGEITVTFTEYDLAHGPASEFGRIARLYGFTLVSRTADSVTILP